MLSTLAPLVLAAAATAVDAAREPLRFAWPRSGSAVVDLHLERGVGETSLSVHLRERLAVEPLGPDGDLLVRMSDPEILSIHGVSFSPGRSEVEAEDVARVFRQFLPSFTVGPAGEFLQVRDPEGIVRAVFAALGLPPPPMGMSAFADLLSEVAATDWQSWVGLWVGAGQLPGEWSRQQRVVSFEGALMTVTLTRRAHEPLGGHDRCRLEVEAEYPSESVRRYTTGFLLDLAIEAGELGTDARDALPNWKWLEQAAFSPVAETVTVEAERRTLRPIVVERTRTFFAVRGKHRIDGYERRTHRFSWEPAVPGASPSP